MTLEDCAKRCEVLFRVVRGQRLGWRRWKCTKWRGGTRWGKGLDEILKLSTSLPLFQILGQRGKWLFHRSQVDISQWIVTDSAYIQGSCMCVGLPQSRSSGQ